MENNFKSDKRQEGRIFAGIILVGVGAALLMRNSGFPFPNWLFSWPVILILVGIYSGFKHNFKNNTWIIMIGIGGFFLVDRFIPDMKLAPYFWPVIIIAAGVLFILRPDRNRWLHNHNDEKKNDPDTIAGSTWQKTESNNYETDSTDFLKVSSVFSGIERSMVSKNFQGGRISCVFGGADIDLTQADIQGKKEIRFEVVFGGVKLIVPPNWVIYNQIDGVFHGVEDKRRYNAAVDAAAEKVLILKGSVVFGGVEIKSY
ncbi:LiaF transmembrane domain-containing protein [Ferruginibacter sp. SUN106]|uniref:LiaF transmembrane domain-containing protein n=1 Tax=Ferruginibacter sp. SUN106 TaxID=2978348 RepID=UPI003D367C02